MVDLSHGRHRSVLIINRILNGVCACLFCTMAKRKVLEYKSEYEIEIVNRPNYETHPTHFVPLTHEK